jgi:hypothetical protein
MFEGQHTAKRQNVILIMRLTASESIYRLCPNTAVFRVEVRLHTWLMLNRMLCVFLLGYDMEMVYRVVTMQYLWLMCTVSCGKTNRVGAGASFISNSRAQASLHDDTTKEQRTA